MQMNFEEFVDEMTKRIPGCMPEYNIKNIHTKKVFKNNGIACTGLAVCIDGENVAPNIYLEYFYNEYKSGLSMEEIMALFCTEYQEARKHMICDYADIGSDKLLNRLFMKLVNYERNKERLKDCPHVRFLDLAITFSILVKQDSEGTAAAGITNKDLDDWGISADNLFDMAKESNSLVFPPKLLPMDEAIKELSPGEDVGLCRDVYVLSNSIGLNGAIYMTYTDIIGDYADEINSNLYILPSSIHEVLLLPDGDDIDEEQLSSMVRDINEYVVSNVDFLSDSIYYYDRITKGISVKKTG